MIWTNPNKFMIIGLIKNFKLEKIGYGNALGKRKIRLKNFLITFCHILSDYFINTHFLFEILSWNSYSSLNSKKFPQHSLAKMSNNLIFIKFAIFCMLSHFTLAHKSENCEHIQLYLNDFQSQKTSNYNFTKQHLPFNGRPLYYSLK